MREEVRIIVLSVQEWNWLMEMLKDFDDDTADEIEMALEQFKKAYINDALEVTLTIRFM